MGGELVTRLYSRPSEVTRCVPSDAYGLGVTRRLGFIKELWTGI